MHLQKPKKEFQQPNSSKVLLILRRCFCFVFSKASILESSIECIHFDFSLFTIFFLASYHKHTVFTSKQEKSLNLFGNTRKILFRDTVEPNDKNKITAREYTNRLYRRRSCRHKVRGSERKKKNINYLRSCAFFFCHERE